eukprot:GHVS01047162.1.p1 GENE.GHVS01047162.1~~GHVS01047162.1.p1  ORF type:complete len:588 (+),score=91.77 GHVS01047162.1:10-1773(+)
MLVMCICVERRVKSKMAWTNKVLFLGLLVLGCLSFSYQQEAPLQDSDDAATKQFIEHVYNKFMDMTDDEMADMIGHNFGALLVVIYNNAPLGLYPIEGDGGVELFKDFKAQLKEEDVKVNLESVVVRGHHGSTRGTMSLSGVKILKFWEFFTMTGKGSNVKFEHGMSFIQPENDEQMAKWFPPAVTEASEGAKAIEAKLKQAIISPGNLSVLSDDLSSTNLAFRLNISEDAESVVHMISKTDVLNSKLDDEATTMASGRFAVVVATGVDADEKKVWETIKLFLVDEDEIVMSFFVTNQHGPYAQAAKKTMSTVVDAINHLDSTLLNTTLSTDFHAIKFAISNEDDIPTILKLVANREELQNMLSAWKDAPEKPKVDVLAIDLYENFATLFGKASFGEESAMYEEFAELDGSKTNPKIKGAISILMPDVGAGVVEAIQNTGLVQLDTAPPAVKTYFTQLHTLVKSCDAEGLRVFLDEDVTARIYGIYSDRAARSTGWNKRDIIDEVERGCQYPQIEETSEITYSHPVVALTFKTKDGEGESVWSKVLIAVLDEALLPDTVKVMRAYGFGNRDVLPDEEPADYEQPNVG